MEIFQNRAIVNRRSLAGVGTLACEQNGSLTVFTCFASETITGAFK
jgi:hypothetical protein